MADQLPEDAIIDVLGETVDAPTTGPTAPNALPNAESLPATPSAANTIRNVRQTAQEREIIKTAPDIVVFLDGLPYLINSYLNDPVTHAEFIVVNFNNHVQNFSASWSTDTLVPTGTIGISVANHQKYLYQSPGGNNLITTMMEVQVFAKGYYLSKQGNTVYHRVFKGLTSHVTHVDNGKTLEISVQCRGILRFLELMQVDLNVSLDSNSNRLVVPFQSNQSNLDPYQQIADTFLRGVTFEGFQLNVIANKGQNIKGSDFERAVQADYVVKWQSLLNGIRADTHVMGYLSGSVAEEKLDAVTKDSAAKGTLEPQQRAEALNHSSDVKESDSKRDAFVSLIRGYTPDFKVGSVQLVNGRITSRLERIRHILTNIGFEGFQDLNGEIIFKAPLYNLDVTNLGDAPAANPTIGPPQAPSQADNIFEENNPFVVYLTEIENESENEDESAIRCTRMSVQGNWSRTFQITSDGTLREVASHIDIPKLARFGLREEPARTVAWIENADKFLMYTYAVNSLVSANRGFRTYSFTIPLRPELRLGFPMYIPHKDMYGYIKSITMNYQIAGAATMSIMLDTIRKRPMFPSQRTPSAASSRAEIPSPQTILTTQPNLVMKWTQPSGQDFSESAAQGDSTFWQSSSVTSPSGSDTARPSGTGDTPSADPSVNFLNNPATQVHPPEWPGYDYKEQLNMANFRKNQLGTDWSTRADTKTRCFRVQNDKEPDGKPFFSRDRWLNPRTVAGPAPAGGEQPTITGMDSEYFQKILTMQPFTDEKGYEVVGVFPLGRWKTLKEAIKETREGNIVDYVNPQVSETLKKTDAFLFAGLGTPSSGSSDVLLKQFTKLTESVEKNSSFELDFKGSGQPGGDSSSTQNGQPDSQPSKLDTAILTQTTAEIQQRVNTFVDGAQGPLPQTKQELQITNENASNAGFSSVVEDFKSLLKP